MPGFNRRQFFRLRLRDVSREAGKALRTPDKSKGDEEEEDVATEPFFRPPGALADEAEFLATCEHCHDCSRACPHEDVIRHFGPADGPLEGTPFIDPRESPCRWCADMPCINACPVDALRFNENGTVPRLGEIKLDLDQCLNSQGTICDTCSLMCPGHIHAIRMVNRMPVLNEDECTACGMCLFYCEARPGAFSFDSGRQIHS